MAIRNVVTGGIGLNDGVIGWVVTFGFGALSAGGGAATPGFGDEAVTGITLIAVIT